MAPSKDRRGDGAFRWRCLTPICRRRLSDGNVIASQIATALSRPLHSRAVGQRPRYSKDPLAYAEFVRGYRLSSSGDPALLEEAQQRLGNAVTRDPGFS